MAKSKIPADVAKRLYELGHNGAIVSVKFDPDTNPPLPVPVCMIWADRRRSIVYWIQLGVEDQHHSHAWDVSEARLEADGRDVWVLATDGRELYIDPIETWRGREDPSGLGPNLEAWPRYWAEWVAVRDDPARRDAFYGWIEDTMWAKLPRYMRK